MATRDDYIEQAFPSTDWVWESRKIKRHSPPHQGSANAVSSAPRLAVRDRWSPLTITLIYRGGAEAWYQIRARGRVWHFPGHLCLHDCIEAVNTGRGARLPGHVWDRVTDRREGPS